MAEARRDPTERPATATDPDILNRTDAIIRADRRVTTEKLALQLSVSKGKDHRFRRKIIFSELLERFHHEGKAFLSRIITGDETWVHHFEHETETLEWRHPHSPKKKKFKTVPSAGEVMITAF
ncbi:hypothetical protein J437_LFUL000719 [Ladona fulva]|uniref:Transposase n=1 Tax=Ladona fulva TaxID=123851 RepID=A0A8K0NV29_LADFU|nr:hypothetical protein J437_LFUL000719 [Ladona fulva]